MTRTIIFIIEKNVLEYNEKVSINILI